MTLARVTMAALAVAGSLFAPPAHAADVFVSVGTGTNTPGIFTTGCLWQYSFTYSSVLMVDAGEHSGIYQLTFQGASDICETFMSGSGSATITGELSGSLRYSRTGTLMTMSGTIHFGDPEGSQVVAATCEWTPTSIQPIVTYATTCRWVLN